MSSPRFIIGIGASAGGLEALKAFFAAVPADTRHTFVVVQHQAPDHDVQLTLEIFRRALDLPVNLAEEGLKAGGGRVYLNPASANLILDRDGSFQLAKRSAQLPNLPIDVFFRSLGESWGKHAVGIVLSGSGSDGSHGVAAIKDHGGLVMAQNPSQSKFSSMPSSALQTGMVDFMLPVEAMPAALNSFAADLKARVPNPDEEALSGPVADIFGALQSTYAVDFRRYKSSIIMRRIDRRRVIQSCNSLEAYAEVALADPEELKDLGHDLLIGVTQFFRDPELWAALAPRIERMVAEHAAAGTTIRAWSVACSTGQEAYTLAILIQEEIERQRVSVPVKIFATDVWQPAVDIASHGTYPREIEKDVPAKLLKRYFDVEGEGYRVREFLRRMLIVSRHDILSDSPFGRVDLAVCRNALIYFVEDEQERALNALHFSLRKGGTLFLGPSESTRSIEHALVEVDRTARIYEVIAPALPASPLLAPRRIPVPRPRARELRPLFNTGTLHVHVAESALQDLDGAAIFFKPNFEVMDAIGSARRFFESEQEGFSTDLLKLLKRPLTAPIRRSVREAQESGDAISTAALVDLDGHSNEARMTVRPVHFRGVSAFLLMIFPRPSNVHPLAPMTENEEIEALRAELQEMRALLQANVEETETANEELQSTNEELLASNEELQSTNEELQSVNEELHTVNAEFRNKVNALSEANADLDNLFSATGIGTVFLEDDLTIRKFTPAIIEHLHLIPADIGRPLTHFATKFIGENSDETARCAERVVRTGEVNRSEVLNPEGSWFLRTALPFVDEMGLRSGVVLTFFDITPLKDAEKKLAEQNNAFEQALNGTLAGYWDWNIPAHTEYLSPSFKAMFGYEDHEMENSPDAWQKLIHPDDLPGVLENFDAHVQSRGEVAYDNTVRYLHKDGSIVWVMCRGKVIEWNGDKPVRMVGSHVDITSLKAATEALKRSNAALETFAFAASHDLQAPLRTLSNFMGLLHEERELDEEAATWLDFSMNATTRMQKLVRGLLDYARFDPQVEDVESFGLSDVVDDVLGELKESQPDAYDVCAVGPLPRIESARHGVARVLRNLLDNALRYRSPARQLKIEIATHDITEDEAIIVVRDNGSGIASKDPERVFEIFQRMHPELDDGVGIGLSHCRRIVERLGGRIWYESTLDEGSAFFVALPREDASGGGAVSR